MTLVLSRRIWKQKHRIGRARKTRFKVPLTGECIRRGSLCDFEADYSNDRSKSTIRIAETQYPCLSGRRADREVNSRISLPKAFMFYLF